MPSGHVDKTKLRPLSETAKTDLRLLVRRGPQPRHHLNPGVSNRLMREELIEQVGATYKATPAGEALVLGWLRNGS